MQWGDVSFTLEATGDYLSGTTNALPAESVEASIRRIVDWKFIKNRVMPKITGLLESRQVKMQYLVDEFHALPSTENFLALQSEIKSIEKFARKFEQISSKFLTESAVGVQTTDFECYASAIDTMTEQCGKIPDSLFGNLKSLYTFCANPANSADTLNQFIREIC